MTQNTRFNTQAATKAICSRRGFVTAASAVLATVALTGCGKEEQSTTDKLNKIVIGSLPTEDILPLWVAQSEGIFEKHGLDVEVSIFQSATELIAGVSSGSVDFAMTDPMVAAGMVAAGVDISLEWVTLGETAQQGRFGIITGPDSDVHSIEDLAGVPIGVGSNTILEYVMDTLMLRAGIPEDQILTEELQKIPVRYQEMMSGEVKAAALPNSLLVLGEQSGCTIIADDTEGENISQSVMVAQDSFIEADGGEVSLNALETSWDEAAVMINNDPERFREILVKNANLSDVVADIYPISEYPLCARPTNEMVDPVLDWMLKKGYLKTPFVYDEATGKYEQQ